MQDLRTVLRLVEAGKIAVTEKNRQPTPASIKQVLGVLEGWTITLVMERPRPEMRMGRQRKARWGRSAPLHGRSWCRWAKLAEIGVASWL